jgi:hypothetical protein
MLGSRKAAELATGLDTLISIYDMLGESNRKYYEFQMAVVEARGIPLLVRLLESRGHGDRVLACAAVIVRELTVYSKDIRCAFSEAGVLFRPWSRCCHRCAGGFCGRTLRNLGANNENMVTIATGGAIPLALLSSPSDEVQKAAARALRVLGVNHTTA